MQYWLNHIFEKCASTMQKLSYVD